MEGKRLIKNKKIELAHVSNGYAQTEFYDYEPVSKFVFISKEKSIYSQKIKVELVRSSESEKYGTNTMINHGIQNFTEESRRWVNFIQDSVDEEMRIREGVAESTWSSVKKKKMGCVPLYGWKIDQMYKLIDGNPVKYENRDIKKRTMITVKQKNPSIKIHIEPVIVDDVFQGIYVIIKSDQIFFGTETAYYIDADEGYLCRITDEYYKQMEPVLRQAKLGGAEFEIGRNNLQEFYYNVLPMLDEYADVTEKNSKQIEQYLLPETRFTFYLDAQDNDVDCKVTAKYGDKDMTQRLQKMVKPFILRRLKTDVLKDLPDKLEETRVVKFDGEQQKLYDAQVVHMKEEIAKNSEEDFNKNKLKILAELTRIRQIIRYFFFHNLQVC